MSAITGSVLAEVSAWQQRPPEATYAVVFSDALRVKIRDKGAVLTKSVYHAIGITSADQEEVLGLWLEQTEGAKFWLRVMTDLKGRGVQNVLTAVVDGLKGFPEAITEMFPDTLVQTCIMHLRRYSLDLASWEERNALAAALKPIYTAQCRGRGGRAGGLRGRAAGRALSAHCR